MLTPVTRSPAQLAWCWLCREVQAVFKIQFMIPTSVFRHYRIHLYWLLHPVVLKKKGLFWHLGQEDVPVMAPDAERQPKKVQPKYTVELPKVQTYYHIEYNLLPDESEPIKVDLVMCGSMAKVYMDNETKVINQISFHFDFERLLHT